MSMSRTPSLFLYPGSKRHLQQHILPKLSDLLLVESGITTYCEPFFGGGGLGLKFLADKPPIEKVVINCKESIT
jgi:site-specific DNA-adenine methylase